MTLDRSVFAGATVVFDLDGTLVESLPDLAATLNVILNRHGLPSLDPQKVRSIIGRGARALLTRGFEANGQNLTSERADILFAEFIEHYTAHIADNSFAFPGVENALDQLAVAGARLAVCTNKRTDLAVPLLKTLGLSERFAAIVGPDLAPAAKPDPRHLLTTLALAGGDPARAIMVGDSATDADTARAAGVPLILVTFGYTEIPAADLGADVLIDHFDQIPAACAQILAAQVLAA